MRLLGGSGIRWIVEHARGRWSVPVVVGWATGLGLFPAVFLRVPVDGGLLGRVGLALLSSLVATGVTTMMTLTAQRLSVYFRQRLSVYFRQRAAENRPFVRRLLQLAAAVALVSAGAGVVAFGWSGESAGAVALVVLRLVLAGAVGTVAAVLPLMPTLWRHQLSRRLQGPSPRRRPPVWVLVGGALSVYLSAGCFLLLQHQSLGDVLLIPPVALTFLVVVNTRASRAGGHVLGAGVALLPLGAVLFLTASPPGASAVRALAEVAIAGALGTAVVRLVRGATAEAGPRLRALAGVVTVLPLAYLMFLLFDNQLLGGVLEAPVFVLMAWLAVRVWRWMLAHPRTLVSVAADIVFALLLGTVLVLLLVWLANLLDLPVAEVKALHIAADRLGAAIDLPWWVWADVFALLTALYLYLALGRGPRPLRRNAELLHRLRLPGVVGVVQRTLTVAKIGLVLVVFLGLTAPPALGPLLAARIRDRYTVSLRQELDAAGERTLYQALESKFAHSPVVLPTLTALLLRVHESSVSGTDGGGHDPTAAERDLARRMGELQARTLVFTTDSYTSPQQSQVEAAAREAGLDDPLDGAADLDARLHREQRAEESGNEHQHEVDLVAELAATAVTSALGSVTFGHGEVMGIVREYLDGLAESPLRDTFLTWTERLLRQGDGAQPPPTATELVEPDPQALRSAADGQLTERLISQGIMMGTDPAQTRAEHDPPIEAAVDLAEQDRDLEEGTTGCAGCEHIREPESGEGGGDHQEFHGE